MWEMFDASIDVDDIIIGDDVDGGDDDDDDDDDDDEEILEGSNVCDTDTRPP